MRVEATKEKKQSEEERRGRALEIQRALLRVLSLHVLPLIWKSSVNTLSRWIAMCLQG
ncbi:MAG: hypothetical protein ACR5K7_02590 [Symbiopectobacterium sp.]